MQNIISIFFHDDDGAVTVDFVVLTAAICLLGFIVLSIIGGSTTNLANAIRSFLDNVSV